LDIRGLRKHCIARTLADGTEGAFLALVTMVDTQVCIGENVLDRYDIDVEYDVMLLLMLGTTVHRVPVSGLRPQSSLLSSKKFAGHSLLSSRHELVHHHLSRVIVCATS
jgi:hypothetical protein